MCHSTCCRCTNPAAHAPHYISGPIDPNTVTFHPAGGNVVVLGAVVAGQVIEFDPPLTVTTAAAR
jgi:hypothetical protein